MKIRSLGIVALLATIISGLTATAQEVFVPREVPLSPHGRYVPIDLRSIANEQKQVVNSSAAEITVHRIPFNLIQGGKANHLFLKPIGWSDVADESKAYPGYIANYDRLSRINPKTRAIVHPPMGDYGAIWLLAATDDDENLSEVVTFRFGIIEAQARTAYHDFEAHIPRAGDKPNLVRRRAVRTIPTDQGNLYLMRIPVNRAIAQDYRDRYVWDLDITKQLRVAVNQPDPYRYQLRPLGLPSGVRIYGMTLERAQVQMEVTSSELGHIFNQPQKPTFHFTFRNHTFRTTDYRLEAVVQRDDGKETTHVSPDFKIHTPPYRNEADRQTVELPVTERGHYEVTFKLMRGKAVVITRHSTFAILAKNDRKHFSKSPFGTWDFGGTHYTPRDEDLRGQLSVKAGLRYVFDSEKYGIESMRDHGVHNLKLLERLKKEVEETPGKKPPKRLLVFHETAVSGPHVTRTPDVFTGRGPYKFSEAEEKKFKTLWDLAEASYAQIHEAFPGTQVYFGNGVPHTIEAFVRRGFPKKYLTIAGNESGSFMRPPETQPLDFVANNAGLWMFRKILDHYGYQDTKLYQCFEMCYPNTNPGNLSYQTQADYYVRHIMHSLSWNIPIIRPATLTDMGNSYYHSNWGGSGLCHAWPHVRPKRSYVAVAVLTQVLDGATFVRAIPTGSPVVYALEFKLPEGDYVTCLWTTQGKRDLRLQCGKQKQVTLVELLGREKQPPITGGKVDLEIGTSAVYLKTQQPIEAITPGKIHHEPLPEGKSFQISPLDKLADWTVEKEPNQELEIYNFMSPRRKGNFTYRDATEFEGQSGLLEVKPKLPVEGPEYLRMYSVLSHNKGVAIPGEPTEIAIAVNGNGGWGRVIFELEDASGQRWISLGAEQKGAPNPWLADWLSPEAFKKLTTANLSDWNSNDAWARSYINHEGWRYLTFPLPGNYPGDGYHWPRNSQWRASGDGKVHYPLTFKKLVVTIPEKVLYLTKYEPVKRQEIYLKDLKVTYRPIEELFPVKQE